MSSNLGNSTEEDAAGADSTKIINNIHYGSYIYLEIAIIVDLSSYSRTQKCHAECVQENWKKR